MTQRVQQREPERTLPHSLSAERAVLGAVLLHGETYDEAADLLEPADFFRQAHGMIFGAMGRLADAQTPVEFVTLREELSRAGELAAAGGPAYLSALVDGLPHGSNISAYAQIVKEKARLREAIRTASKLLGDAYEAEQPSADIAAEAAERLYTLGTPASATQAVSLSDLMAPSMELLEKAVASGQGTVTGLPTGFAALDDITAGLQPSDLTLVAARTSQGKTALLMNFARHVSASVPVLVFSLEMSRHQLFMRLLAAESSVDLHRIRSGQLSERDWRKIGAAYGSLGELRLLIVDTGGIGVREVRAQARQAKARAGLGAIFVDYVQLMRGRGRFDNRTQEIGTISRGLKAVAKELDVPIVAAAQLSRASVSAPGRKERPPELADLAESGSLENDADIVLFIYRPPAKDDGSVPSAQIIVSKQRNGPTGTVRLAWNPACVRFESIGG